MVINMKQHSIIALVLLGVISLGCAKEIPDQVGNDGKEVGNDVTLTTTVSLGGAPASKALTAAGEKTFAPGEQVAIVYTNTADATVKAVCQPLTVSDIRDQGKTAIFTVTLTDPKPSGAVRYIYPATMAAADGSVNYAELSAQDGTLASLSAALDLALFEGTLTAYATLPARVSMDNPLTIGEFTVSDGTSDITSSIVSLTISAGADTYTINRAAAAGPIYVAMLPVADTETLTFIATDHAATPNHFIKLVSGKALESNNMYPVRLTMYPALDIAELTGESYTVTDGYWLYGTQTSTLSLEIADDAHVTLAGVSINADGSYTNIEHSGITCLGDATITLAGGTINTVRSFEHNYSGIQAGPAGTTLTINGTGTLNAYAYDGAAIGGSVDSDCGNITIEGGIILADCSGACGGTGIGAGSNNSCGNITINGGYITATSGSNEAAGIGASQAGSSCGSILISGGTVIATGTGGPGIGPSIHHGSRCGSITIGTGITSVTATKGYSWEGSSSIGIANKENECGDIYFNTTKMYSRSYYYNNGWIFWPTSGSDYGGLHIEISNDDCTWTLTPSNP